MPFNSPSYFVNYFFKKDTNKLFTSRAIRNLAIGMVLIFEPIYLFQYFEGSITLTLIFFAAFHTFTGVLVAFSGNIISKIGSSYSILASFFASLGYYLVLTYLNVSYLFVPLALLLKTIAAMLYWPSFHLDFTRFSKGGNRGENVGKLNVAIFFPIIIAPVIGGWIVSQFGYPALFSAVLVVFVASSIPLFFSSRKKEVCSDDYEDSWERIFKKENRRLSLAFAADSIEIGINKYVWPLFLFLIGVSLSFLGTVTSIALLVGTILSFYLGKLSDYEDKRIFSLNLGAVLTSISWVVKYFIITPVSALLAQVFYRLSRSCARVPFRTYFYEKASFRGDNADEFIVSREIVCNLSRAFVLYLLAFLLFFIPKIEIAFIMAAVFAFGFMFLGRPPKVGEDIKKDIKKITKNKKKNES